MSALKKILLMSAGLAAVGGLASPAAAQITVRIGSGSGYSGYGGGGYAPGYGYGNYAPAYGYGGYSSGYNDGYGGYGSNYGYSTDPRGAVAVCARAVERNYGARVTGINSAEPRNNGAIRVHGYLTSYGQYSNAGSSLGFTCKVDAYSRITDLQLEQNGYYRGW